MTTEQSQIAKAANTAARFLGTNLENLRMERILAENCLGTVPFTFMLFKTISGIIKHGVIVGTGPARTNLISNTGLSAEIAASGAIAEFCKNSDCNGGKACAAKRLLVRQ